MPVLATKTVKTRLRGGTITGTVNIPYFDGEAEAYAQAAFRVFYNYGPEGLYVLRRRILNRNEINIQQTWLRWPNSAWQRVTDRLMEGEQGRLIAEAVAAKIRHHTFMSDIRG